MLCDSCNKNPATVHLTEIIDDQMTELHLCEECAHQKSAAMEQQFGLSDLLAGLTGFNKPVLDAEAVALKCPVCKLTYADFKKLGRLGCGHCYQVFSKYLTPLLKRIHGSTQHVGKLAKSKSTITKKVPKKKSLLEDLRFKLAKAIENEEFEEAAKLRDEIKAKEKKEQAKEINNKDAT